MGQAYRLPKRVQCEICKTTLSYNSLFFYIINDQPYAFCMPEDYPCFKHWYTLQFSPENFRPKGLL